MVNFVLVGLSKKSAPFEHFTCYQVYGDFIVN